MMKPRIPSVKLNTPLKRPMTALRAPWNSEKMVVKIPLMISTTEENNPPTPFAMSDMIRLVCLDEAGEFGNLNVYGVIKLRRGNSR